MLVPGATGDEDVREGGGEMSERPALPALAWGRAHAPVGQGSGGRAWGGRPPAIPEQPVRPVELPGNHLHPGRDGITLIL